jgi:hypothetical protein
MRVLGFPLPPITPNGNPKTQLTAPILVGATRGSVGFFYPGLA